MACLEVRDFQSFGTVIEYDQVATEHVKPVELLQGFLSIMNVLIDYKRHSLLASSHSLPYLSDRPIPTKYIIELLSGHLVGQIANIEDAVDFRRKLSGHLYIYINQHRL